MDSPPQAVSSPHDVTMRSLARSTLALFITVAATAIVGVAHAAEARTTATADSVMEAGRWIWGSKNSSSSYS